VFTRVGASDDIAGGQSTFMREMTELTEILHEATADSLVLLDEVGRGTSTADGRAIARATAEFVHDEVGATTLFATHYHELTELAAERERIRNLHFAADRGGREGEGESEGGEGTDGVGADGDHDVTFLHRVAEGPASSSYGVEVARMAGVPDPVVERARSLVADRDSDGGQEERGQTTLLGVERAVTNGGGWTDGTEDTTAAADTALSVDDAETEADMQTRDAAESVERPDDDETAATDVAATLRETDLATTTPIDALNLLSELQSRVEES
jgi:DNA mismatch repair protein MutS